MIEEKFYQTRYLSKEILEKVVHKIAREIFANEKEPMVDFFRHDPAKLDSCLNTPRASFNGVESYPGIFQKAAAVFYLFNKNHAFENGNKRIATAAFVVFLYLNNKALLVSDAELTQKAIDIARTNRDIREVVKEVALWAEANSQTINLL